jgi:hypothetical protein
MVKLALGVYLDSVGPYVIETIINPKFKAINTKAQLEHNNQISSFLKKNYEGIMPHMNLSGSATADIMDGKYIHHSYHNQYTPDTEVDKILITKRKLYENLNKSLSQKSILSSNFQIPQECTESETQAQVSDFSSI